MVEAAVKLRSVPVKKLFFSYLVPSVLGLLLMSVNIVIDGIFVGRGIGPEGLAGVNVGVPVFSILLSISLCIGIGGAALYSMALGNNEPDKARNIFTQSFLITLVIAGAVIALPSWFGANGIWLILPAAEALTALLLWIMNRRKSPLPEIG